MESLKNIVLLIDAENTQLSKLERIVEKVSAYGHIAVKRAYGNWKKESLKNWESELKRLAIKAEQQFDYVTGKSTTDMALVIDAIHLLYRRLYDAFVIASSDSDYTPLAINLHESGLCVIGVGEKKTPESFRNSCDFFLFLENIGSETENTDSLAVNTGSVAVNTGSETKNTGSEAENKKDMEYQRKPEKKNNNELDEIHVLLQDAYNQYKDGNGYMNMGAAGAFIKKKIPNFNVKALGYAKLSRLIEDFPDIYEVRKYANNHSAPVAVYRLKKQE